MRKQNIPAINDEQILETITLAKQGSRKVRLNNIKKSIKGAYANFIANSMSLGTMSSIKLGKIQKKDMEHCYNSPTAGLLTLKAAIKDGHSDVDKQLCPYCNIREPSEFDHYLPKSKFQEFAVFSKNLIWTCHQCNHKKKEHFSESDRYLNTYYDAIPEAQFLFCRIGVPIEEEGVCFYLEKPQNITDQQYKNIVDHACKLKLLETYEDRATQKLPNWLKKWKKLSERYDSTEQLKQHITNDLEATIEVNEEVYGLNHMNVVLMKSVVTHLDKVIDNFYSS